MPEIRIGWPDTFVRLRIPRNWSALRYLLKHPESFVIGVYGFNKHHEQTRIILAQQEEIQSLRAAVAVKNDKLRAVGKELSAIKREKNTNRGRAGHETACKA